MGSFQQITMGIGCLIAAFWFGSVLQDRPAGQNQTVELLPDGTIDPYRTTTSGNLATKTKGFLDSFFSSPSKEKPITVDDLRADAKVVRPNLTAAVDHNSSSNHDHVGQLTCGYDRDENPVMENSAVSSFAPKIPLEVPLEVPQPTKRLVGSFEPVETTTPRTKRSTKVAIVPDFSSLAEEVNRGLSFNDNPQADNSADLEVRPLASETNVELIPVPKLSDVETRKPAASATTDWERVREQVEAAERRLEEYRAQMTQPIPEIAKTVNRRSQEFWDRQQSEARRRPVQPSRLATHETSEAVRQRRLKPETWQQKQQRWDVFANNRDGRGYDQGNAQSNPTRTQPSSKPKIVEVDRPYADQNASFVAPTFATTRTPATKKSSAVVRSLNDDRVAQPMYGGPGDDRYTYNARPSQPPREVQNQLRPKFNPSAGSQPEFVSPPDHRRFTSQANSSPSRGSDIVEAAKVTYGSFREYETRPQDTLQRISEEFYGTADYYFDLYLANRDLLSNPATVPAGITIKIPRFDSR